MNRFPFGPVLLLRIARTAGIEITLSADKSTVLILWKRRSEDPIDEGWRIDLQRECEDRFEEILPVLLAEAA